MLLALAGLPSCDKVRTLAGQLAKKPANPAAGPQTGEIPKGIREMWSGPSNRIVLVDFYADWCGPCRQLAPILDEIAAENGGTVLIGKVNIDQFRTLATREGVHGIPDVRIFRDGKKVDGFVGLPDASEVRRRIETHMKGLPAPVLETADAEPSKPKEPAIQPMTKDWLPPGIKRR